MFRPLCQCPYFTIGGEGLPGSLSHFNAPSEKQKGGEEPEKEMYKRE